MDIELNKLVRLKFPQEGEENIIYKVVNYNEITGKCYIEPTNLNFPIPPQELVSINELINA